MQLSGRRFTPNSRWQLYDIVLFKDVVLVVFCHWSDESNCVSFVEPNTREAFVLFIGSSSNGVSVVLVSLSDDISDSYTSDVVANDVWRRAKMAMMSIIVLGQLNNGLRLPGSSMVLSTTEKYGVVSVGDHVRDTSHIGSGNIPGRYLSHSCMMRLARSSQNRRQNS